MNEQKVYEATVLAGTMEIDAEGRVWRIARLHKRRTGEIVPVERQRAERPSFQYLGVQVRGGRKMITVTAHRLVWFHFHGPIPEGLEINHRNGDRRDNRPENLELVTHSENIRHALRVLGRDPGAARPGEGNPTAKLTADNVREIRARLAAGETQAAIAADYGVCDATISHIKQGRIWREENPDFSRDRACKHTGGGIV